MKSYPSYPRKGQITLTQNFENGTWYAFHEDGGTVTEKVEGAWAVATCPTGQYLGDYATLKEARAAFPTAYIVRGPENFEFVSQFLREEDSRAYPEQP